MARSSMGRNPSICLTILSAIAAVSATCYLPNGNDRNEGFPNATYYPVHPDEDVSMCCSKLGDKPRDDGLCANSDNSVIWRESCTDRTWQSPKCIKLCADSSEDTNNTPGQGRQEDNDEQVTPCADGSYCCGDGSLGYDCCSQGRGVFVRDGTTQKANPTATSSSAASSQTPLAVSTTTATAAGVTTSSTAGTTPSLPTPSSSQAKSKNNAGAIAGGVVGGLAALCLIIAALYLLFLRRRRKDRDAARGMDGIPPMGGNPRGIHEAQGSYQEDYKRSELQAGRLERAAGRTELDSKLQYGRADKAAGRTELDAA
ncbi:MAG: hypothetical protein Q9218_001588 [Villophora microphyllina]